MQKNFRTFNRMLGYARCTCNLTRYPLIYTAWTGLKMLFSRKHPCWPMCDFLLAKASHTNVSTSHQLCLCWFTVICIVKGVQFENQFTLITLNANASKCYIRFIFIGLSIYQTHSFDIPFISTAPSSRAEEIDSWYTGALETPIFQLPTVGKNSKRGPPWTWWCPLLKRQVLSLTAYLPVHGAGKVCSKILETITLWCVKYRDKIK